VWGHKNSDQPNNLSMDRKHSHMSKTTVLYFQSLTLDFLTEKILIPNLVTQDKAHGDYCYSILWYRDGIN